MPQSHTRHPKRWGSCAASGCEATVTDAKLVYLDASAFVKLVLPEPETAALVAALDPQARLVASEILEIEVLRAVRRASGAGGVSAARTQLEGIRLLPISDRIRKRACELEPETLRTLDAIHIATALDLGGQLDGIYAYDLRMTAAAAKAGLLVYAPTEAPTDDDDVPAGHGEQDHSPNPEPSSNPKPGTD
jgi:uncharacterized protein